MAAFDKEDFVRSLFGFRSPKTDTTVPIAAAEYVDAECKAVLSGLVSQVDTIAQEEPVLSWLSKHAAAQSPKPSRDEADAMLLQAHRRAINQPAFAERLYANRDAMAALMRLAFPRALRCIAVILCRVPDLCATVCNTRKVYALLRLGACSDPAARLDARRGIGKILNEAPDNWFNQILATDEFVAFLVRAFEDGWDSAARVFKNLNDAKKIQVYIALPDLWKIGRAQRINPSMTDAERERERMADEAHSKATPSIDAGKELYDKQVCLELERAFRNDVEQPHMATLVDVGTLLGLKGGANIVLTALAPHVNARITTFNAYCMQKTTEDKQEQHDRELKRNRLRKAYSMLLRPENRIIKQFTKAMPSSMLPPPPKPTGAATATAALPMASMSGSAASVPLPALMPSAVHVPLPALMPPAAQAAPPVPLALPPPSPDSVLRCRILPRRDCAKCAVARGLDASVRSQFATEGGHVRGHGKGSGARDISKKRACPLLDHAINVTDIEKLLEQYENDSGVKLPNKKKKIVDKFMQNEYNVECLGRGPHFAVSLYSEPRTDVALAVEGGRVQLKLRVGYKRMNEDKPRGWYGGFMIVPP